MYYSILLLAIVGFGDSAADSVTFRDGKVLLGQIVEPAPRGKLVVIVRREWAEKNLPDRFKAWKVAEAPSVKKSRDERLRRLEAWKRERTADASDAIVTWIDAETSRLKSNTEVSRLMVVNLNRGDVRNIVKRPASDSRKLKLAWRSKFDDAETKTLDSLTSALEARGFAPNDDDIVSIDDLLPISSESEPQWLARRAATEVSQDAKLRFVSHLGLILPEGAIGANLDIGGLGGLLKGLVGDAAAESPLEAKGREIASKGGSGMLVTTLETAEDLSGVKVEIVLYARTNGERWERAAVKSVRVGTNEIKPGDGANIADDPQVKSIFKTVEGLGLAIPDDLKNTGLNIGAATQKALGKARTAIQPELEALNLIK